MDVGTAKPTRHEQALVPHHLIDVCEVHQRVTVVDYVAWARQAVEAIEARGRAVLVVGGSGFYLKGFFGPIRDDVEVPETLRREVEQRLAAEGLPAVVAELRRLNPQGLGTLDLANPRRVVRACPGALPCLGSHADGSGARVLPTARPVRCVGTARDLPRM